MTEVGFELSAFSAFTSLLGLLLLAVAAAAFELAAVYFWFKLEDLYLPHGCNLWTAF